MRDVLRGIKRFKTRDVIIILPIDHADTFILTKFYRYIAFDIDEIEFSEESDS